MTKNVEVVHSLEPIRCKGYMRQVKESATVTYGILIDKSNLYGSDASYVQPLLTLTSIGSVQLHSSQVVIELVTAVNGARAWPMLACVACNVLPSILTLALLQVTRPSRDNLYLKKALPKYP